MEATALLKRDHKTMDSLFKKFEEAGPGAHKTRRRLADQIIEELSVHAAIEELVFYPAIREAVPDVTDEVLESLEEHHVAKWLASEVEDMAPDHERFKAKMMVLIENTRHHMQEEEEELFPEVREALTRTQLNELGEALEAAKQVVPERPHPRAPDTPPGNVAAAPGAACSTGPATRCAGHRTAPAGACRPGRGPRPGEGYGDFLVRLTILRDRVQGTRRVAMANTR